MGRDAGQIQSVAKACLKPMFRGMWRVETTGLENVPTDGPAIMAPNHVSVIDSFFLPLVLDRRITFVGKAEYLDDWKTKYLFPALGMIPIDRAGGDSSQRALDAAAGLLDRGELFGIYPEGTRSRTGLLHKGHTGAARLAVRTGAPIVPVGILGTAAIQPPDASAPRPFRPPELRFGRPIHPPADSSGVDHLFYRQMTDEVMYEIRNLTGQHYVDEYALKPSSSKAVVESLPPSVSEAEPERRSSADVLGAAAV